MKDTVDSMRYTQNRVFEQSFRPFSPYRRVRDHVNFGKEPANDRDCVSRKGMEWLKVVRRIFGPWVMSCRSEVPVCTHLPDDV